MRVFKLRRHKKHVKYIKMVVSPTKIIKSVLADKMMILLIGIIVAVVVFSLYNYFYAVKEPFAVNLANMVDTSDADLALPLAAGQRDLLNDSGDLMRPIKTVKNKLSRIINMEGLCAGYTEPNQLSNVISPYAGEGCGWYYKENPDLTSFPAYGNARGPLNPQLKDVAIGGKWHFSNLEEAQKKENVKRCLKIRTCQLTDLFPGRCAWCNKLGYAIPIDPQSGRSLYPEDDLTNCFGNLTKDVEKCPPLEKSKLVERDDKGNIVEPEPMPKPVCDPLEGKLSKACLLFLAEGAGILKQSAVYRVINGDPDGYLQKDTYNNRNFKIAWEIMKFRARLPYDAEIMGGGQCTRKAALRFFNKLVAQTGYGFNPRTRKAALFLAFGEEYTPDIPDKESIGPYDVEELAFLFKECGGQPAGLAFPTVENINRYNGTKLGAIMDSFKKTCTDDVYSSDINIQANAVKQCMGTNIKLPLAGCDKERPAYVPKPAACNPGNVLIGEVSDAPTAGVEMLWYSFDSDLTFPERRQQVATYYGRQIKLGIPSITKDSIPFNKIKAIAFVARTNIKYNGPIYKAKYNITASEGVAIKVNSKIIMRNWAQNKKGTGLSNDFKVSSGDKNFTEMFWFSTNAPEGKFLMSILDKDGEQQPIQSNMCELRVPKGFPVARWDFYTGVNNELNGVLSSSVSSTATNGNFQNKPCLLFSGANPYVITDNKIAGSAFRSFATMLHYSTIGAQGSNRVFVLRNTNSSDADETSNYLASDSIEAGITKEGSVFAVLKPAKNAKVNLLSVKTPDGTVSPNTWFHMAVSCSQNFSEIKIFINGEEKGRVNGSVDQAFYDNMVFDYGSIGMGYVSKIAGTSNMAFKGGIAWQHWFDYQLCKDDVEKDRRGAFCNTEVYPITQDYMWPMTCGLTVPKPAPTSGWKLARGRIAGYADMPRGDYTIEFDLTVKGIAGSWVNIIRVGNGTGDCCGLGQRSPSIWVIPGQTSLHVRIGDQNDGNWGVDTSALTIGKETKFKLVTNGKNVTVSLDDKVITAQQPSKRATGNGFKIFLSDPYYGEANVTVDNLIVNIDGKTIDVLTDGTAAAPAPLPPPLPAPGPPPPAPAPPPPPPPPPTDIWKLSKGRIAGYADMPKGDYSMSFDLTVKGTMGSWGNIIRVGNGTGDCCGLGQRSPSIWVIPGQTSLHVRIGDQNDGNWGVDTGPLVLNKKTPVRIVTSGKQVTISVDGKVINASQPSVRATGNAFKVYMSDPWYDVANAQVENLVLTIDGKNIPVLRDGVAPLPPPPAPPPITMGKINIVEASYGKNCNGNLKGNRTDLFKGLANGKSDLQYSYNYTQTGGDPAGGCGKTLEVVYNCGSGNQTFLAPPEAGFNAQVKLACGSSGGTTDLGCWRDTGDRQLKGSNQGRPHTKESCEAKARALGHKYFAVQDGNECYTGNDDYKRHGKTDGDCPPGGGGWKAHTWQIN